MSYDGDDVSVRHGRMHEYARCVHVRHDRHQIHCLMAGCFIDLEGVCQPAMIIAGVRDAPNDGYGHPVQPVCPIQTIYRANQTGRIAAGQFQIILADTHLIIGIAMKKHIGDRILLASLEDSFYACFFI
ncbi:hypothetical protein SDC9_182647 [bioreactor metagenome]|uniref:Uncharacterized protein n=1 Tax=bioreactor metagenome TaxID=1076179 RepID=A0A645H9U9_9ZZZZ